MITLAVDIGNSRTKAAVFNGHRQLAEHIINGDSLLALIREHQPQHAVLSSVGEPADAVSAMITEAGVALLRVNHLTPLPFVNAYATPETLGMDRLAGVAAARFLYPGTHCLVIDAGTCITYDFISADSVYSGGAISPGLTMRLKAMHAFTHSLPLPALAAPPDFEGRSTTESLLSGVVCSAVDEINGRMERYTRRYGKVKGILCGGDALMLAEQLKNNIFATPSLVMTGLNQILLFNVNKG